MPDQTTPPILRYFEYAHLPEPLLSTSRNFSVLAHQLAAILPACEERDVALRKLLEAKDAGVRAALDLPRLDG
ncbi:hypothetical protein RM863_12780 [Streptomyces sp. DSM 41014]|uniref:Uncharacterized protein n=1 Tax=Streptomyces hintoniae TaxID=3075521 RepID=A0ABU2UIA9_9ACTN|nr:hypothetical protein [Streptomyces sp. DSM 41014]MDT0472999.1 hypothetical protein [Streptomyces sp. DSM 41014]